MPALDRRRASRPCPPAASACWLKGGPCEQCIPAFALEAAAALEAELRDSMAPEFAKCTARRQSIALVRQCSGASIGSTGRLDRQQQRARIRRLDAQGLGIAAIAAREGVHRATVYRALGS